jgi:hypothetical protein
VLLGRALNFAFGSVCVDAFLMKNILFFESKIVKIYMFQRKWKKRISFNTDLRIVKIRKYFKTLSKTAKFLWTI